MGNEALIGEAIAALDITRIMIAHRPQTIAIASRIYRLLDGGLVDVTAGGGHSHTNPEITATQSS